MQNNNGQWWPLCLSETVSASKPVGLQCGDLKLAVFRDKTNTVRVVEDRCPHRRAPLSLGRITETGHLQCGYHGWTFNGETGDISAFPNLDEGERLPRCAIETFNVMERNGLVYVSTSADAPLLTATGEQHLSHGGEQFTGSGMIALSQQEAVVAMLDAPAYILKVFGIEFLGKPLGDPREENGLFVAERVARWNIAGETRFYLGPLRHRADFPLRLTTYSVPVTGETIARIYNQNEEVLVEILIAFVQGARGMTSIYWRASIFTDAFGKLSSTVKAMCALKRSPVAIASSLNCHKLAKELPNIGEQWRIFSAESGQ